uniref:Uncharacterized protein n=1 Tax=Podoviridae sp. cttxo15 TaxID=2826584 RepID=A0A8S5N2H7_9CAUD|nr:MAG TPA: hypothetical protein [Podoviridae sp. cttxo15]DAN28615.1 MAG TPA: hypothetical protein [Bacteriophage sp.]DAT19022.1 MAG TPA: hypothetical protein [Caudoviricetes sp.]DAW46979.1 MAG TPA: hypothetical protein [Caudoviricetes sp.]
MSILCGIFLVINFVTMPKLSNAFRNFITSKKRYALAYSNGETASGWRKEVFKIKSHLS